MKQGRLANPASSDDSCESMSLEIEQWGLVSYRQAYARQLQLVDQLQRGDRDNDVCMILEHPPVFTLGRNSTAEHVGVSDTFLKRKEIELIKVERGGEVTYHGPGQIVCYPIINLRRAKLSVLQFVRNLEEIMLEVVKKFGIKADRDPRNHGIWCRSCKLGSVGIAIKHGITYHGLALNVTVDLEPFGWINPCGLDGVSMTSMQRECKKSLDVEKVKETIIEAFGKVFQRETRISDGDVAQSAEHLPARRSAKPKWLKQKLPVGPGYEKTRRLVKNRDLHTVCQEARCPNQFECYGKSTATFLIMGEFCTRNCRFCAVAHRQAERLDPGEPHRIAKAVEDLALDYVVLTSVTRDDLDDGGAGHFVRTMQAIRKICPDTLIEVLIPDLMGNESALQHLCRHHPAVVNHNVETVARLYPEVRPQAIYERSLMLLRNVKKFDQKTVTKSGLMVGLGETKEEIEKTMADIRECGCDLLTLGQYLQPTKKHLPVHRFVPPKEFDNLRERAFDLGFKGVAAGPHVRSSYQAETLYNQVRASRSA